MGFREWHIFFNTKFNSGIILNQKRKIMIELKEKHCAACEEGMEPLNSEQIKGMMSKLHTKWEVADNKMLRKEFPFENFNRGMAFAQNVALTADKEDHHPEICIHYSSVEVELSTHKIGGLSENDFIMAAKIDEL
jgi:4a-hydroxytetrahydrobiopterin dehydratase